MNYWIVASTCLYLFVCTVVQSTLLRRWLRHLRWWWVGVNLVGLAIAYGVAVGLFAVLVFGLGFNVLQNSAHSITVILVTTAGFWVTLSGLEGLVLRNRLPLSWVWAALNPLTVGLIWGSIGVWILTEAARRTFVLSHIGVALSLSMGLGAIAGALTGGIVYLVCNQLNSPPVPNREQG